MNAIIRYHVQEPGELWVRLRDGKFRRAAAMEEINLLHFVPDLGTLIGWKGPALGDGHYLN